VATALRFSDNPRSGGRQDIGVGVTMWGRKDNFGYRIAIGSVTFRSVTSPHGVMNMPIMRSPRYLTSADCSDLIRKLFEAKAELARLEEKDGRAEPKVA
jgi:hypothetical protein